MRDSLVEMTEWLLGSSTSTYPMLSGPIPLFGVVLFTLFPEIVLWLPLNAQ